jgi:ribosomal protein S17E
MKNVSNFHKNWTLVEAMLPMVGGGESLGTKNIIAGYLMSFMYM